MAISDYSELQTATLGWLNRPDIDVTTLELWLAVAEAEIRSDVRTQSMESTVSGTLTGDTLAHPTGMLVARRLTIGGKVYYYRSPEVYQAAVDAAATLRIYTSIGQSFYILGGASGDAYTLTYTSGIDSLTVTSTNWLLTYATDVYLWAMCKQGSIWLKDPEAVAMYDGRYQAAVAKVNDREKRAASSGSALQIAPATSE
jgi:hypothetical protein